MLQPPGRITGGRVVFQGTDLLTLPEHEMRRVRGAGIGFVFQEPMAALNPVMRVGDHIAEALIVHGLATQAEARPRAVELLRAVRIAEPEKRVDDYPHQLSGGMRQRVMIAIALACKPPLVIADEPTTALDVTVQAQILDLLRDMKRQFDLSLLLITHDLGVIAETADRVAVMYAGRIVEAGRRARDLPQSAAPLHARPARVDSGWRARAAACGPSRASLPNLAALPPGCTFAPRCPDRMAVCGTAFRNRDDDRHRPPREVLSASAPPYGQGPAIGRHR